MLSLDHLLAGADTSVIMARSDAIDTPLTPTNFNLRPSVTNGSYPIQAARIDQRAVYVDQSGRRLYALVYDIANYNYKPTDLTRLNPDIGIPGFFNLAVQRQPDTRINLVRSDGQLVSFLDDVDDEVQAFWRVQTAGVIEDVVVLPGRLEDQVYVIVKRTVNGSAHRFLEKFARIDECQGAAINKNVDCHAVYQGAPTTYIANFAPWLGGQTVCIWADGTDQGTAVIDSSGGLTLPAPFSNVVAGLSYTAQFLTTKLAYAARSGTAVNQIKRVDHVGFVLQNTHYLGLRYGAYTVQPVLNAGGNFDPSNFNNENFFVDGGTQWDQGQPLYDMPLVEAGTATPINTVWAFYDQIQIEFGGESGVDARVYLEAASPRPCTVVGMTVALETAN